MNVGDVQDLVDALAERLQRSVAIDDPQIRLIAVSRHFGDEDEIRVQFLLWRQATADIVTRVLNLGLERLEGPELLAADEEHGMRARLCVPIRYANVLLGYMWLIEAHDLREEEMADVCETADAIAMILYRRYLSVERRQALVEGSLRELLSSDAAARSWAVAELLEEGLVHSRQAAVIVVRPAEVPGQSTDDTDQEAIRRLFLAAITRVIGSGTDGAVLGLAQRHRLVLVVTGSQLTEIQAMRSVADTVLSTLKAATGRRFLVGLGAVQENLQDVNVSYAQAVAACRAAQHIGTLGEMVSWDEMGIYAMLINFTPEDPELVDYPAELLRLCGRKNSEVLLNTAETFLDHAGDVQATASALHIHRATLYQRLERIGKLSGLDMSSGTDRLLLHLGIKLAHLTGIYPQLVTHRPDSGH